MQVKNQKFQGFTIVELMIAITLMATGVVAIYALIPYGIKMSAVNTDKYLATQLAREGIEIIRNIRDTNWIEDEMSPTAVWDEGLTTCAAGCEVDYTTPTVQDPVLTAYQGRLLRIDDNGFYQYGGTISTPFKRRVVITSVGVGFKVQVFVSWSSAYPTSTLEEILYDWR